MGGIQPLQLFAKIITGSNSSRVLDFMYLDTEYLKYYDFYGKRSQRRATDREREGRFKQFREEARCKGSLPVQRLLSIQRTMNYFNVFFSTS